MVEVDGHAGFHRRRPCACCCLVLFVVLLILAIIIVILAFTVFKAKKAEISVERVELLNFQVSLGRSGLLPKPSVNITLGILLAVHNPNKASFKYTNSTAVMYYHDDEVALVPVPAGTIGSDDTRNISTTLVVLADQLITSSHLAGDFLGGSLPFVIKTQISGRVKVLFIKRHVDISSECSVSVLVNNASIGNQECNNKVSL